MIREKVLRPEGRSMNSSSESTILCWFKCPTGSIMDGNVSAKKKRSYSTCPRRSMFTARPMRAVFHPMGRIFLMIGREKTDNKIFKLEARNPKFETNPNYQSTKFKNEDKICFINLVI